MASTKVVSSKNGKEPSNDRKLNKILMKNKADFKWWLAFSSLTFCSFITRLSYLGEFNIVTWDEVHFGGFANQIINGIFYPDVHPPLGKTIIGAAAYITGYKANYNFSSGSKYDDRIRYQLIRSEMAIVGALLVPVAYLIVYEMTKSIGASSVGALSVLCDTFLHKINSLIILDPLLNVAIAFCVLATLKVNSHRKSEWSLKWWCWLILTGFGLGLVMSIKYIGVFTVLFVGLHTTYQLLLIYCDRNKHVWEFIPHFLARVVCQIFLPVFVYLLTFVLQFAILTEASQSEDNGWMHTRLLATLNNTEYDNKMFPKYVNYGANITLMSSSPPAGYLDSWFDLFPSELTAPCQVTSTVPIKDPDGTLWRIRRVDLNTGTVNEGTEPTEPPILVRNGDLIMLTHLGTERSLRSHGHRAPFTKGLHQVCTYGDDGSGGPYETWQVTIPGVPEGEPLKVFEHDFLLKNYKVLCYLKSTDVRLPSDWAHEGAFEVGCARSSLQPNLKWHINWIESFKVVGETSLQEHQFGLWEKIVSIQEVMIKFNSGIKNKENYLVQKLDNTSPWMWPIAYRMQLLGEDKNENSTDKFAVAGFNPLVAYINIISILLQAVLCVVHLFKVLRITDELPHITERRRMVLHTCLWLSLCWWMHYFPFFFMGRTLYLHHYCPAYLYSCLISGVMLNYISEVAAEALQRWLKKIKIESHYLLLMPSVLIVISYMWLYPLATYVEGIPFQPNKRVNQFLEWVNLGQPWVEFGFQAEFLSVRVASLMLPIAEDNFQNPNIDASLHYGTFLNITKSSPGHVTLYPTTVFSNITSQLQS